MDSSEQTLKERLSSSDWSIIREELTTNNLIHQIQLYGFRKGRYIQVYKQAIDIHGCDIIIEDGTGLSRKIQLKTKVETGKQSNWAIHGNMLLPDMARARDYGISDVFCPKLPGAVILQKLSADDTEIHYKYWYCDINVITFFYLSNQDKRKAAAATKILSSINGYTKTKLPFSLFVPIGSAQSLLNISGFLNETEFDFLCHRLNKLYRGIEQSNHKEQEIEYTIGKIKELLKQYAEN